MEKLTLVWWKSVRDIQAYSPEYPSVVLSHENNALYCKLTPCGMIEFIMSTGGGHGESREQCNRFSYEIWHNLLEEAKIVASFYWK